MAVVTTTSTSEPGATPFKPYFQRISQGDDRHADVLACIAMLCKKSLSEIFIQAETLGLPKVGPYWSYVDGDFIARLLAANGLVATVWKEAQSYSELPDVCLALVLYEPNFEVGHCVLYHANTQAGGKTSLPYVVDPYPHTNQKLQIRIGTGSLADLPPSWYIGVHPMTPPTAAKAA